MKSVDVIYDIFGFIVFMVIFFFIIAAVDYTTQNQVDAQINDDVHHMRSQEVGLAFMRSRWVNNQSFFRSLSYYYSLEDGQRIEMPGGEEVYPSYMEDRFQSIIGSYRSADRYGSPLYDNLYVEGFDGGDGSYGVTFPVPDSKGDIKLVKAWSGD